MAKLSSEMWILIFVAVVAVVGLGILLMQVSTSGESTNISGQAIKANSSKAISTVKTVASITCSDTDGGKVYDTKGTVKWSTNTKIDECYYGYVREWYCQSGFGVKTSYKCNYNCEDGACYEDTCSDTDGGKVYDTKGTVKWSTYPHADECYNSNTLYEWYCKNGSAVETSSVCDYKCEDGACVEDTRPDFEITYAQIVIYPSNKQASVYFHVTNNGKSGESVHANSVFLEEIFSDGTTKYNLKMSSDTTTIAAGKSETILATLPVSDAWISTFETFGDEDKMYLKIIADYDGDVSETDETNNVYEKDMYESKNDIMEGI